MLVKKNYIGSALVSGEQKQTLNPFLDKGRGADELQLIALRAHQILLGLVVISGLHNGVPVPLNINVACIYSIFSMYY